LKLFSCREPKVRIHAHKPLIWNAAVLKLFNADDVVFQFYENESQYRACTENVNFLQSMSSFLLGNGRSYETFALFPLIFKRYRQCFSIPVLDRNHGLLSGHVQSLESRYSRFPRRFVTVHVRSGSQGINQSEMGRNSDIDNFVLSIKWLLSHGFAVIRMGDRSMKPLTISDPLLIDHPFSPNREHLDDFYFLSNASLHIGTQSGPLDAAGMFGTPILLAGAVAPAFSSFLPYEPSIYMPKFWRYKSTQEVVPIDKWLISNRMSSTEYGKDVELDSYICDLPPSLTLLAVQYCMIKNNESFIRDALGDLQIKAILSTINSLSIIGKSYLKLWNELATSRGFVNKKTPPLWYFGYIYGCT